MRPLTLALIAAASIAVAQGPKLGTKASAFTAKDLTGKSQSLSGLLKKGPVVLYFIKHDCPANAEAVKYYNAVAGAYNGKANLVGVINGDKAIADAWSARFKPTYPVLLDPDMKIIRAYQAEMSPWATMVDKKGKVSKVWPGASKGYLTEINKNLAMIAKTTMVPVNLNGLPAEPMGG